MDTPSIQKHMVRLRGEVAPFSNGKIKGEPLFSLSSLAVLGPYKIYLGIALAIFIGLLVIRPSFVYTTHLKKKSFSFGKLLTAWLIICIVLVLGIYGYNYKMNH